MYADLGKLSTNMMCHRSKTPQPCMGEKNQPSHSFQYGLSDNRGGANTKGFVEPDGLKQESGIILLNCSGIRAQYLLYLPRNCSDEKQNNDTFSELPVLENY